MSDFVQNGEFSNPTAPKFVGRFYETENVETHPGTAILRTGCMCGRGELYTHELCALAYNIYIWLIYQIECIR